MKLKLTERLKCDEDLDGSTRVSDISLTFESVCQLLSVNFAALSCQLALSVKNKGRSLSQLIVKILTNSQLSFKPYLNHLPLSSDQCDVLSFTAEIFGNRHLNKD